MIQTNDTEEAPPRFTIWSLAWVFSGFYAICVVLVSVKTGGASDAYGIGQTIGAVAAALGIPTLVAFLAWRMTGHSSVAANVTFFIVFGLIAIVQLAEFGGRIRQQQILAKALEEQREKPAEQMRESANASSGGVKPLAEVTKDYLAEVQAAKKRYDDALKVLASAQVMNLSKFAPGPPVGEARRVVESFRKANSDLLRLQDAKGAGFARYLTAHGMTPDQVTDAVAAYRESRGVRDYSTIMRECDDQLAQVMLEFLNFEEKNMGHWHIEASTQRLTFDREETAIAYNAVMERANRVSQAETQYQKLSMAR